MRIKKTSQYIEGGASLSNVYGTSNENGYTQSYINGLNTYSTDEKRVGTWIDGKPLYRRTIYSTTKTGSIEVSNIDFIRYKNYNIKISTFLFNSDRYSLSSSNDQIQFFLKNNGLEFEANLGSSWVNNFQYLVFDIEYTKTTD